MGSEEKKLPALPAKAVVVSFSNRDRVGRVELEDGTVLRLGVSAMRRSTGSELIRVGMTLRVLAVATHPLGLPLQITELDEVGKPPPPCDTPREMRARLDYVATDLNRSERPEQWEALLDELDRAEAGTGATVELRGVTISRAEWRDLRDRAERLRRRLRWLAGYREPDEREIAVLFRVKTRAGGAVAAAFDGFREDGQAFAELLDREADRELSIRGFSPIVEAHRRADLLLADYQTTDNAVVFRVRFIWRGEDRSDLETLARLCEQVIRGAPWRADREWPPDLLERYDMAALPSIATPATDVVVVDADGD